MAHPMVPACFDICANIRFSFCILILVLWFYFILYFVLVFLSVRNVMSCSYVS